MAELRPIVNEIKEIEATKVAQGQIAVNVGSAVLANTVPASVRWIPSTRISLTTNGSKASAGDASKAAITPGSNLDFNRSQLAKRRLMSL